jgi:GST-like protein
MIDLYGGVSPNAIKILLMLEELDLPYRLHNIRVMQGEQYSPDFLALNPLGKYPVIIDHDGAGPEQPIFESGAILMYLAETYAPRFLPASGPDRWETLKWLMVQMSWVGPMIGQHAHFRVQPSEAGSYAATRYRNIALRVCETLDERLKGREWLAGDVYTIADMATFPWINPSVNFGFDWEAYETLLAWRARIAARPASIRALAAVAELTKTFVEDGPRGEDDLNRFFLRQGGPTVDYSVLGIR